MSERKTKYELGSSLNEAVARTPLTFSPQLGLFLRLSFAGGVDQSSCAFQMCPQRLHLELLSF